MRYRFGTSSYNTTSLLDLGQFSIPYCYNLQHMPYVGNIISRLVDSVKEKLSSYRGHHAGTAEGPARGGTL